jgi:hypothetical protein
MTLPAAWHLASSMRSVCTYTVCDTVSVYCEWQLRVWPLAGRGPTATYRCPCRVGVRGDWSVWLLECGVLTECSDPLCVSLTCHEFVAHSRSGCQLPPHVQVHVPPRAHRHRPPTPRLTMRTLNRIRVLGDLSLARGPVSLARLGIRDLLLDPRII